MKRTATTLSAEIAVTTWNLGTDARQPCRRDLGEVHAAQPVLNLQGYLLEEVGRSLFPRSE